MEHCGDVKPLRASSVGECGITVAVVGQPSTGKSTFFTYVTGEVVRIASWPGTTVEQRVASVEYRGVRLCFVDLPGIYGLAATSPEEAITKKFLLEGEYDVVLVLVDPLVIERSIYLPLQLAEMGVKLVVAVTKWDVVHKSGLHVDVSKVSARLGVPVVPISSITGEGVDELMSVLVEVATRSKVSSGVAVDYGPLNSYVEALEPMVKKRLESRRLSSRWVSLRLLEGDEEVAKVVRDAESVELAKRLREEFKRAYGLYPEDLAVYARYKKATEVLESAVVRVALKESKLSKYVDSLFTDPRLGPALSLATLFLVFLVAFTVNTGFPLNLLMRSAGLEPLAEALETYSLVGVLRLAFTHLADAVRNALSLYSELLAEVVADGIIESVGLVLSFAPLVLVVSSLISVLEDSGLGPRMVHSLHRFLSVFGLSGRSLYPLVVGLGCNVPAVVQSRVSIDEYERLQVVGSVPFILCQARLVVMMYFAQYLFPGQPVLQSFLMLTLYATSIALYLLTSKLLRTIVFKVRESPELIMEIPPLHRPSARVVWWNSWIRVKHFLVKAGTVIFVLALASWAMVSLGPTGLTPDLTQSYAALVGSYIGKFAELAYEVEPESSWKVGFALLYGTVAKEGLITSIAALSSVEEAEALRAIGLTTQQAVGLLFFFMFYVPCLPTIAVIYQESRSTKFTVGVTLYLILVAAALSILVYRTLELFS